MANVNSRHSIEGKHGILPRLGEDSGTVSWGGSTEAIQPTGPGLAMAL